MKISRLIRMFEVTAELAVVTYVFIRGCRLVIDHADFFDFVKSEPSARATYANEPLVQTGLVAAGIALVAFGAMVVVLFRPIPATRIFAAGMAAATGAVFLISAPQAQADSAERLHPESKVSATLQQVALSPDRYTLLYETQEKSESVKRASSTRIYGVNTTISTACTDIGIALDKLGKLDGSWPPHPTRNVCTTPLDETLNFWNVRPRITTSGLTMTAEIFNPGSSTTDLPEIANQKESFNKFPLIVKIVVSEQQWGTGSP